jgi:hypothetical protein
VEAMKISGEWDGVAPAEALPPRNPEALSLTILAVNPNAKPG